MTQKEIIMKHLEDNGRITTFDAIRYGITRLSARIWELRQKGVVIDNERVNYKASDGKAKHYDIYTLVKT